MARIIDEVVTIRVSDLTAAAASTSVNTAAVVGVTTKDNVQTQVLYSQDAVKEAYETGTKRIIYLEPSLTTASSGEVELKLGTVKVASAKVKAGSNGTNVRSMIKALASSFKVDGYSAVASATRLTISSDAYGATESEDGTFSIDYNDTGFSGSLVNADGEEGADIVNVTKSFFEEEANPGKIVCIPVGAYPTAGNIADTLYDALALGRDSNNRDIDFYHVIVRLGESATANDVSTLASALESWCRTNDKQAYIEVQDRTVAEDAWAAISTNPPDYVSIFFHKEASKKCCVAALVANRCANDPARGTWDLKNLPSIEPDATGVDNYKDAYELGVNIYAPIASVGCVASGTTGSKTKFIDTQVKKRWLKFRSQEAIFDVLRKANGGDGADFDDSGIQDVVTAMTDIFKLAEDNEHRYIMKGSWEITAPLYKDIPAADKDVRNLPRVRAVCTIMNSIHTVKTVEIQVV